MTSLAHAWAELDTARYKAEFYRMWYAGHHAGLTNVKCLEVMDDFARSPTVKQLRDWALAATRRRASLAQMISSKPHLFLPFEGALLKLGEESGQLEECLKLLGDYFEAEHRMIIWLKGKMSYPFFNLLAASFIAPFPILFFGDATKYLLIVSGELALLFLAGGGMLKAAARYYGQKPKIVLGRLLRALTTATEAGLTIDRTVALAVEAAASPALTAHVKAQGAAVGRQPLATTFQGSGMLPPQVIAALNVAEATGDYSGTLKKLAELYDGNFAKS